MDNGIYLDIKTSKAICSNKLIYDSLTSTFKIDLGIEIILGIIYGLFALSF